MTKEIKEILYLENYISKYKGDEKSIINGNRLTTPAMLDYLEVKSILNYITNLQKENENLKEENKRIFSRVNDDELLISNAKNYAELQDYKSRNEKAAEKLGKYRHYTTPTEEQNSENEDIVDSAYNILQGGDE